jgi:DNA phosphorothioation system restriction enzyme
MGVEKNGLRELDLPPEIETDKTDFIQDFYNPSLERSVEYKRGVGYFTSSWMEYAARGVSGLAENGGTAKWIMSPILDERDWKAFEEGNKARIDEELYKSLEREVEDLETGLKNDTLNTISWMIADGLMEIKFAIPEGDLQGDFHDKWGVLTDDQGNRVAFHGSQNDSKKATENYESYDIFCDWLGDREESRVDTHESRFDRLWNDEKENLRTYSLPEGVREQIIEKREQDNRPYSKPEGKNNDEGMAVPEWVEKRPYQKKAVKQWMNDSGQGILKMATGTGKTLTSLLAAHELSEVLDGRLSLVVAVPYQHLVKQWSEDIREFGLEPVLAYGSRSSWEGELSKYVTEYNVGSRDYVAVVTTHKTFSMPHFQSLLNRMDGSETLLIGDEVHRMGASGISDELPKHIKPRLGLSATPERHYDDEGTDKLLDYFGGISYEYGIQKAIDSGSLCEYYYVPHIVELTEEEQVEYERLSKKIAELFRYSGGDDISDFDLEENENLQAKLFARARLVGTAKNKLTKLKELLSQQESVKHTLVYCGDGSVKPEDEGEETKRQVDAAVEMLGKDLGLLANRFTADESDRERQELLKDFEKGDLQALVAIRCLDEGVDVPATRKAYILASSSNPRQFVQRRGRILRNYEGKENAVIHDFIVKPPDTAALSTDAERFNTERRLVKKELERVETFAEAAKNHPDVVPDWIPSSEGSVDELRKEFNLQAI